jgi:cytochrome oxidase Cu insertion factor (SCO1/SenC/PrrC family)
MAVAAVALFLIAYQWGNQYKYGTGAPPVIGGVLLRPARPLPIFTLTDSAGAPFGRDELEDHWSLLAVGNLTGASGHRAFARLVEIYNRLADERNLRPRLRLVLVTADSAPALARDFERLSPAVAVLSGERAEVSAFAVDALGSNPDRMLSDDANTVEKAGVDQASGLFLLDPDARLVAIFPGIQSAADIAADVKTLARHHQRHSAPDNDAQAREAPLD